MTAHRAGDLRRQGLLAVLRFVHMHPGVTRSEMSSALGLSSGSATEIVGRCRQLGLLAETSSPPTGGRGRPSPALSAHPSGPLVCAVDIGHEAWRVATVSLGGHIESSTDGRHKDRSAAAVLTALRKRVQEVHGQAGHRLRAVAVSVAGTVQGTSIVQASSMRWRDISLSKLRPASNVELLVGNDASLAGLAEARRGVGRSAHVVLHLTVEVGIGGILVVNGVPMEGSTGAAGEFGHMPFGDPSVRCSCGAYGCWDQQVSGRAMARALGQGTPRDPRTKAERVIASGDPAARRAVASAATAFGRGIGGLVNALDPNLVSLSGLAIDMLRAAPAEIDASYRAALMRFRRNSPPPLVPSSLGSTGPVIGAADLAFDSILTADGLDEWATL